MLVDESIGSLPASTSSASASTSSSSSFSSLSSDSCPEASNNLGNVSDDEDNNKAPFQYCYNCAPFHASNGRGPTLVPSLARSQTPMPSQMLASVSASQANTARTTTTPSGMSSLAFGDFTLYNMDSKSNENLNPQSSVLVQAGAKRRRSSEDEEDADTSSLEEIKRREDSPTTTKRRRNSSSSEASSPNTSLNESGYCSTEDQVPGSNANDEDSDSESDTSSDSGHSSDDHDVSSDDKSDPKEESVVSEVVSITKLTRASSTPELQCGVEVARAEGETIAPPASPPCLGFSAV
eukprot:TCALIF_07951-PA protein Name:"Protein of unknown function" AED:0.32 eAED:0.53 QI:0/0/0/1/1/1/3/0/293